MFLAWSAYKIVQRTWFHTEEAEEFIKSKRNKSTKERKFAVPFIKHLYKISLFVV